MNERPLNILMTDPHLRGGGQVRYVTNLAAELTRVGHRVVIGCKPDSVLVQRAAEAQCGCHNAFVFKGGLRPRAWRQDVAEIQQYIRDQQPDVIHVSGSQDHWISGLGNRLIGRPACVVRTRHNTYTVKDSLPNRILNLHWTDYQIVVCDVVRRTLAMQRTFDSSHMCSIHNGVDAEAFKPDPEMRFKARSEFGYTDNHTVCGIAARLVADKGHEFLFKAVASLKKDYPNLRVLALGQGVLEDSLKAMAQELGISEMVQFAGFRDDMAYCTQAFDIGIQPSIGCDTSSFSLKEQMAAEKPVIASDYGGLKEIVSDGVEGCVVPTGTVQPLASAIRRFIQQPDLCVKMGVQGRKRVLREFTIQVFAQRTVDAYRRALMVHQQRKGERP